MKKYFVLSMLLSVPMMYGMQKGETQESLQTKLLQLQMAKQKVADYKGRGLNQEAWDDNERHKELVKRLEPLVTVDASRLPSSAGRQAGATCRYCGR